MRKYITLFIIIILLVSCEERIWDNPFDSKSTIKKEEWTPKELFVEQIALNTFQLSFESIDENIEGYRIDRKIDDSEWLENYFSIEVDSFDYVILNDTTIFPDSLLDYNYRLYAYAGKNLSNPIEKKINPIFPAVSYFTAEQISANKVLLSWKDNTVGEDGFLLYRKINDGSLSILDTLAENVTSYIDSNVVLNEKMSYQILGFHSIYQSSFVSINFTALFSKPLNLELSKIDLQTIKLVWLDNTSYEDGYKIDRQKGDDEWQIGYAVLDENTEEFIDTDVETNVNYAYRIYAYSDEYETNKVSGQITINFEAPENLQFQQNNLSEIEVSWDAENQGEDGFRLFHEDEFGQWQLVAETTDKKCFDTNPNYGENNYKLYAYFNNQKSDSLIQNFENILESPNDLKTEILSSSIVKLSWKNQCSFEHQISVERKNGANDFQQIALLASDEEFTDDTIDSTVTYIYAVRAFVDPYYSEYSDVDTVLVVKPLPFETVEVVAGNFIYGSSNSTQNIPYDYEISKYEITNTEFATFLQKIYNDGLITVGEEEITGNYAGDEQYIAGNYTYYDLKDDDARIVFSNGYFSVKSGYEDHPVAQVSWFGADAFAKYYRCKLPTDFEWEKAARGNNTRIYPWGNDLESNHCNYHDSGDPFDNGTTPVGYYNGWNRDGYTTRDNASYYGAYDMAGNVWEWTSDWYTDGSNKHSTRGGSWYNSDSYMTSHLRYPVNPTLTYGYVGFRVVRKK